MAFYAHSVTGDSEAVSRWLPLSAAVILQTQEVPHRTPGAEDVGEGESQVPHRA